MQTLLQNHMLDSLTPFPTSLPQLRSDHIEIQEMTVLCIMSFTYACEQGAMEI